MTGIYPVPTIKPSACHQLSTLVEGESQANSNEMNEFGWLRGGGYSHVLAT